MTDGRLLALDRPRFYGPGAGWLRAVGQFDMVDVGCLGVDVDCLQRHRIDNGDTVVGPNVRLATFWAIYAEVNARQLAQAIAIGGPITFIEGEEQRLTHDTMSGSYERPWQMWKRAAMQPQ